MHNLIFSGQPMTQASLPHESQQRQHQRSSSSAWPSQCFEQGTQKFMFECLVPSRRNCMGRVKTYGLVKGNVLCPWEWALRSQRAHCSQLALPCAHVCVSICKHSATAPAQPACLLPCSLLGWPRTLTLRNRELSIKCFLRSCFVWWLE